MAGWKPGTRLRSSVCATEVMVVMAPDGAVELHCGGAPMMDLAESPPSGGKVDPAAAGGSQLGKRYVNADGTLELLCTHPGEGSLSADGQTLQIKGAKPLPSSD